VVVIGSNRLQKSKSSPKPLNAICAARTIPIHTVSGPIQCTQKQLPTCPKTEWRYARREMIRKVHRIYNCVISYTEALMSSVECRKKLPGKYARDREAGTPDQHIGVHSTRLGCWCQSLYEPGTCDFSQPLVSSWTGLLTMWIDVVHAAADDTSMYMYCLHTQHCRRVNTANIASNCNTAGGGLEQLVATLVRSTKLLYAGPG